MCVELHFRSNQLWLEMHYFLFLSDLLEMFRLAHPRIQTRTSNNGNKTFEKQKRRASTHMHTDKNTYSFSYLSQLTYHIAA